MIFVILFFSKLFAKKLVFLPSFVLYNLLQQPEIHKHICILDCRQVSTEQTIRYAIPLSFTTGNDSEMKKQVAKAMMAVPPEATIVYVFTDDAAATQQLESSYATFKTTADFATLGTQQTIAYVCDALGKQKAFRQISILKGGYQDFAQHYPFLLVNKSENAKFFSDNYPFELINDMMFVGDSINGASVEQIQALGIEYVLNVSSVPSFYDSEKAAIEQFLEASLKKQQEEKLKNPKFVAKPVYPIVYPKQIKHLFLNTPDREETILPFQKALEFLFDMAKQKKKILIFCDTGRSASAAIAMAFMMERGYRGESNKIWSLKEVFAYAQKMNPLIFPSKSFMNQLLQFEQVRMPTKK